MARNEQAARHLLIDTDKPCAVAFWSGQVLPRVGLRSATFHALAGELRRVGQTQDEALDTMMTYYSKLPTAVTMDTAGDGQPFTPSQVKAAVRSAYKPAKPRSYGCNHYVWAEACPGRDSCLFHRQIRTRRAQSPEAVQRAFVMMWLPAKSDLGRQRLYASGLRVYLALEAIEAQRGYSPGGRLFVSHQEVANAAGMDRARIGEALIHLRALGLIDYTRGRGRGQASEVRRAVPVPRPPANRPRPSLTNHGKDDDND